MWLRVTMNDKPVMINGDRVLKIEESKGSEARRGCLVYFSPEEFLKVDQSLGEIMISLGFEERQ
jgi:hypothetical protein